MAPGLEDSSQARAAKNPPRTRQERAKRLESGVESARGPLSEPTRAANGLESARRPLFEPPRAGCQETRAGSSRVQAGLKAPPGSRHPRARVRSARAQHYEQVRRTVRTCSQMSTNRRNQEPALIYKRPLYVDYLVRCLFQSQVSKQLPPISLKSPFTYRRPSSNQRQCRPSKKVG